MYLHIQVPWCIIPFCNASNNSKMVHSCQERLFFVSHTDVVRLQQNGKAGKRREISHFIFVPFSLLLTIQFYDFWVLLLCLQIKICFPQMKVCATVSLFAEMAVFISDSKLCLRSRRP